MISISKRKFSSGGADLVIEGNGFADNQKKFMPKEQMVVAILANLLFLIELAQTVLKLEFLL